MPTLEVIQEKLKKLQAQADLLIAKKAQSALDQIRRLMVEHGLTTEDIEEKAQSKEGAQASSSLGVGTKRKASKALGTKVAPKFQDPKSGATWSGRGSAPAWIAKAKDRTRFLIHGEAAAHVTSSETNITNATAAAQPPGYRTGPQPAKYRDRKSGATWSGKGRAPSWLANVRDRSKFLIEEEGDSPAGDAATKATRDAPDGVRNAGAAKKRTLKVATTKKTTASKAADLKRKTKETVTRKAVASSKKVAAKKSGPVAKKRVTKRGTGSGDAANGNAALGETQATETPAV